MSTGKRLAKRSILGTRVCAPFDGLYFPGIIQGTKTLDTKETEYSVLFDNKINSRRVLLDFKAHDLIGPGFQSIVNTTLNEGQKIYITYNGREVSAIVDLHNVSTDEVFLTVDLNSNLYNNNNNVNTSPAINQIIQLRRRLDECRLSESRKSARLLELDTDYSRLATDGQFDNIRRRTGSMSSTVSSSSIASSYIDVPSVPNGRKRRPSSSSDDVMDDCMAAMVLMSLSCSPKSPRLPEDLHIFQCTWPGCAQQYETCHQIEQHVRTMHLGKTDLNMDDNSDHEEEFYYTEIEMNGNLSSISSSGMSTSSTSSSPGPQSPTASQDGSCKSENQSPIPSPHTFFPSSSAPVWSHLEDHEYLKHPGPSNIGQEDSRAPEIKIKFIQNFNSNNFIQTPDNKKTTVLTTTPINIPGLSASCINAHQYAKPMPISTSAPVSLQSARVNHKYMRLNGNCKSPIINGGTTLLQLTSNKTSPTKRVRGESRKCRKVYGMDNRDNWCTQCKWKKACSRFTD